MRLFKRTPRQDKDRGAAMAGYAILFSAMAAGSIGGINFMASQGEKEITSQSVCIQDPNPPASCNYTPPDTSGGGGATTTIGGGGATTTTIGGGGGSTTTTTVGGGGGTTSTTAAPVVTTTTAAPVVTTTIAAPASTSTTAATGNANATVNRVDDRAEDGGYCGNDSNPATGWCARVRIQVRASGGVSLVGSTVTWAVTGGSLDPQTVTCITNGNGRCNALARGAGSNGTLTYTLVSVDGGAPGAWNGTPISQAVSH